MGIRIDQRVARRVLEQALDWALSDRPVPAFWTNVTQRMQAAPSKTYTPALGTALLAKAVDPRVDALSIKDAHADNTYSLRTLGHGVLVPAAVEYGFDLRNTGREPLNNQPFFRYDHMDTIDRVLPGARASLNELREALRTLNLQSQAEAFAGLAAFLRVRIALVEHRHQVLPEIAVPTDRLIEILNIFLDENIERPRRTQALAAAAFDLIFDAVATRKLNDPSRDFPGDVQAFIGRIPIMAAEIRAKAVPASEVRGFVSAVGRAGVSRCFLVVIHPSHTPLARSQLLRWAWSERGVVLTIVESSEELVRTVLGWSRLPVEEALERFPGAGQHRLHEIECTPATLERWTSLVMDLP